MSVVDVAGNMQEEFVQAVLTVYTYILTCVCMYVCMYVCTVNVDRMGQLVPKVSVSVGIFTICSGLCILLQPLVL